MSNILEIENLEKKYISESESLTVLKDLNLTVESGKKVVIVGESGSGKSTLLNILAGLDNKTSGEIKIKDGYEVCIMRLCKYILLFTVLCLCSLTSHTLQHLYLVVLSAT